MKETPKVAYFSMEIAFDPSLPTYTGGRGVHYRKQIADTNLESHEYYRVAAAVLSLSLLSCTDQPSSVVVLVRS